MTEPTNPPRGATLAPPVAHGGPAGDEFERLVAILRALRSPEGCPWDREQTLRTLAPFVQEEAAEVVDAIERDDLEGLREEMGDLVFEGVFLAQLTAEGGHFSIADSVRTVCEKLVRRHPHVFVQAAPPGASDAAVETAQQVVSQWADIKAQEKAARRDTGGVLDGVPASLPALAAARDIGTRVAKVGFDWPTPSEVLDKVQEEVGELRAELNAQPGPPADATTLARADEEIGDLLFALSNWRASSGWIRKRRCERRTGSSAPLLRVGAIGPRRGHRRPLRAGARTTRGTLAAGEDERVVGAAALPDPP